MGKFIDSKLYKKVVPKRTQEIISSVRESAKRRNQVSSSSGGGGNVGVTPVVPPPSTSQGGNLMTGGNVGDPGGIANQFNRPPQIKQPDTMPTYNYDTGKYDPPKVDTKQVTLAPKPLQTLTGAELLAGRTEGGYDFPEGTRIIHSDTYARYTEGGPWYNIQAAYNAPLSIKEAGTFSTGRYRDLTISQLIGNISPQQYEYELNRDIMRDLTSGPEQPDIDWMKKYGSFTIDGKTKTYDELVKDVPGIDISRSGKDFTLGVNTDKWMKEQPWHVQAGGKILGGYANIDYIYTAASGNPADPKYIQNQAVRLDKITSEWTYSESKLLREKNYVGAALNIPVVQNVAVPAAMGVGTGLVFKGLKGGSVILSQKGHKIASTVISRGTQIGTAGLLGYTSYSVGSDVYNTYLTKPDTVIPKIATYGTQFASFGLGMKAGSRLNTSRISSRFDSYVKDIRMNENLIQAPRTYAAFKQTTVDTLSKIPGVKQLRATTSAYAGKYQDIRSAKYVWEQNRLNIDRVKGYRPSTDFSSSAYNYTFSRGRFTLIKPEMSTTMQQLKGRGPTFDPGSVYYDALRIPTGYEIFMAEKYGGQAIRHFSGAEQKALMARYFKGDTSIGLQATSKTGTTTAYTAYNRIWVTESGKANIENIFQGKQTTQRPSMEYTAFEKRGLWFEPAKGKAIDYSAIKTPDINYVLRENVLVRQTSGMYRGNVRYDPFTGKWVEYLKGSPVQKEGITTMIFKDVKNIAQNAPQPPLETGKLPKLGMGNWYISDISTMGKRISTSSAKLQNQIKQSPAIKTAAFDLDATGKTVGQTLRSITKTISQSKTSDYQSSLLQQDYKPIELSSYYQEPIWSRSSSLNQPQQPPAIFPSFATKKKPYDLLKETEDNISNYGVNAYWKDVAPSLKIDSEPVQTIKTNEIFDADANTLLGKNIGFSDIATGLLSRSKRKGKAKTFEQMVQKDMQARPLSTETFNISSIIPKQMTMNMTDSLTVQPQAVVQRLDIVSSQEQATRQMLRSLYVPVTTQAYAKRDIFKNAPEIVYPALPIPYRKMSGAGASGFPGGSLDPRYLYREFKLPSIKEVLAKVKI